MLPKGQHVAHVYYRGDNNLLALDRTIASKRQRKLLIDCSTIDAAITRELGKKVEKSGLGDFADAAVSVRQSYYYQFHYC